MKDNPGIKEQCFTISVEELTHSTTATRRGWTEEGEEVEINDFEVNSEQENVFPAQSSGASSGRKIDIELLDLTAVNVRNLKLLNETSLVASYEDRFYKQLLQSVNHWHLKKMMCETADLPKHWVKLAYFNGIIVGAICCQLVEGENCESNGEEPINENLNHSASSESDGCYESVMKVSTNSNSSADVCLSPRFRHVYILTLASLPSFRRRGVASLLLRKLLEWCQGNAKTIKSVCLHVQTNNEVAMRFYEKFHFQIVKKIENYYNRIDPPDAYFLERKISD